MKKPSLYLCLLSSIAFAGQVIAEEKADGETNHQTENPNFVISALTPEAAAKLMNSETSEPVLVSRGLPPEYAKQLEEKMLRSALVKAFPSANLTANGTGPITIDALAISARFFDADRGLVMGLQIHQGGTSPKARRRWNALFNEIYLPIVEQTESIYEYEVKLPEPGTTDRQAKVEELAKMYRQAGKTLADFKDLMDQLSKENENPALFLKAIRRLNENVDTLRDYVIAPRAQVLEREIRN